MYEKNSNGREKTYVEYFFFSKIDDDDDDHLTIRIYVKGLLPVFYYVAPASRRRRRSYIINFQNTCQRQFRGT